MGDSRTCRATVIRDILRGRLAADPDPHGLRLRGARIAGRLDLENLTTDVNLELKDCYLEEGVLARNAHLTSVLLPGCQIEHPAEPPLDATRLNCSVLVLDGARVIGHAKGGAVLLSGAHIGGSLECDGAELRNDSGPALYADRLQVDQSMFIRYRFTASGSSRYGAVYLVGAHISGHLDCARADLCNYSGPALAAYSLQVGEGMYLTGGFTAIGGGEGAAVDLTNARVGGAFTRVFQVALEFGDPGQDVGLASLQDEARRALPMAQLVDRVVGTATRPGPRPGGQASLQNTPGTDAVHG